MGAHVSPGVCVVGEAKSATSLGFFQRQGPEGAALSGFCGLGSLSPYKSLCWALDVPVFLPSSASRCFGLCRGLWKPPPPVSHSAPCRPPGGPWAAQLRLLPPHSINGPTLRLASLSTCCLSVTATHPQVNPESTSAVSSQASDNSTRNTLESPRTPVCAHSSPTSHIVCTHRLMLSQTDKLTYTPAYPDTHRDSHSYYHTETIHIFTHQHSH